MIVCKLKNLLQNKNVIFFIICYRIHSKFITETASEMSPSKNMFCNWSQEARKATLKKSFFS